MKKALIFGITGQDGSYLTELLLSKGYEVHGVIRRSSTFPTSRIEHIYQDRHIDNRRLILHYGDLTDTGNIERLINSIEPDEIYHLGAMSHVRVSFDIPEYTANVGALGTLRILEAIRNSGLPIKFYNAASSEMFGLSNPPQNEETPFHPRSPYAVSKVFSYDASRLYREAYGIFASNGILMNHESPRRGETFVTRKISRGIARIKAGLDKKIYLGNLEAKRDWGFAPCYIEAMWLMLQQPEAEDFVIATGQAHSVKDFLEKAFQYSGLGDWQNYVEFDKKYLRPAEVEMLVGDASKAREKLGWQPKILFDELIKIMIDADLRKLNINPPGQGDRILKEKFPNCWWKAD
jgi:GDPmannose 4,6-dehydratase